MEAVKMEENERQKVALFRYSLIAPLVTETYSQKNATEYLEEVCARKYNPPGGLKNEFAPATLKDWLRLYRKFGIDGLYPKSRSDKGTLRKMPDKVKEYIVSSKLAHPKKTAKTIYQEMIVTGLASCNDLSLSTVQRYISKNKLTTKSLEPVDRKAFEFEFANDCWQSDISVGPYLNLNGKKQKTHLFAILDDASRLVVHCEAFFSEGFPSLLSTFKTAVAKRGVPKKLFVDNGKVYHSNQLQFICASIGSIVAFARPFSPQSKGKIERWFKTLHEQWTNAIDWNSFKSIEDLNESLNSFVENNYNKQVHSSIKMAPIDRFKEDIHRIKLIPSKHEIDNIFMYRATRKVKNDATLSIDNILFEVPMKYIGDKVNVRFIPTDLDKAYIFSEEGKLLDCIYPVDKIVNSKTIRDHNLKPIDFSAFTPQIKEDSSCTKLITD